MRHILLWRKRKREKRKVYPRCYWQKCSKLFLPDFLDFFLFIENLFFKMHLIVCPGHLNDRRAWRLKSRGRSLGLDGPQTSCETNISSQMFYNEKLWGCDIGWYWDKVYHQPKTNWTGSYDKNPQSWSLFITWVVDFPFCSKNNLIKVEV